MASSSNTGFILIESISKFTSYRIEHRWRTADASVVYVSCEIEQKYRSLQMSVCSKDEGLDISSDLDGGSASGASTGHPINLNISFNGGVHVGDTYNAGNAVVQGPGNSVHDLDVQQSYREAREAIDLRSLTEDLSSLLPLLENAASCPDNHVSVAAVRAAQEAARQGDRNQVMQCLAKAGTWVLGFATAIGASVAAAAIALALGLQ